MHFLKRIPLFYIYLVLDLILSVVLLIIVSAIFSNYSFLYFIWNIFLAWIPLILSIRLYKVLSYKLWSSWEALGLTFLWLLFLPNSFYMISDFIHIANVPSNSVVYFTVIFTMIVFNALIVGNISVLMIHKQILKRITPRLSYVVIALILAASSYAIYIGRVLRWNSWDLITNPGGVIFDLSYQFSHFKLLLSSILIAGLFLIVLVIIYALFYNIPKISE